MNNSYMNMSTFKILNFSRKKYSKSMISFSIVPLCLQFMQFLEMIQYSNKNDNFQKAKTT